MVRSLPVLLLLFAASGAVFAAPALAGGNSKKPVPKLAIEPIFAPSLLAPAEPQATTRTHRLNLIDVERAGLLEPPLYRLEREADAVTGKRAKLSVPLGDTRLFAVGGKLSRRARPGSPDPSDQALTSRKLDSGRLYGGGVERTFGAMELGAAYQYSRINAAPLGDSAAMRIDDKSKSHSVQVRARLRF